jgi:hypothetical protein
MKTVLLFVGEATTNNLPGTSLQPSGESNLHIGHPEPVKLTLGFAPRYHGFAGAGNLLRSEPC